MTKASTGISKSKKTQSKGKKNVASSNWFNLLKVEIPFFLKPVKRSFTNEEKRF